MKKILVTLILAICRISSTAQATPAFDWGKATVYFVITDRFLNGDQTNDVNYGRVTDYGSERLNAATFHGGDFKGMLAKAEEGYFTKLGVDVVWMTDVYEQIHGWMSGSGQINDFPHYGYHGYYPLDYTQTDKNYGTVKDLRELVDTLHGQGIRVMLGANLNNPGYPTLLDAVQYGFADTGLSEKEAANHRRDWSYDIFFADRAQWDGWYGRGWIRMPDEDWNQDDPLQATLFGLPDFKDESLLPVKLPRFLKRKWEKEGQTNDAWVNPSATHLRKDKDWSPAQYVIAWIASWVEEFGIDGMRCDIVENVNVGRWKELKEACDAALGRWRRNHPEDSASQWDEPFFMTGDFEPSGIEHIGKYARAGFSNIVNNTFPKSGDLDGIVYTWQAYSDSIAARPAWFPFSFLNNSYHRDTPMENMENCATTLFLAPGAIQLFYGDESRRGLSDARFNADSDQAFRSDMNWETADTCLLTHFQKLGNIRKSHPAIGLGRQHTIDSHTCVRTLDNDTVVIALKPELKGGIDVSGVYPDNVKIVELYTGQVANVVDGKAKFPHYERHVAILTRHTRP